MDYVSSGDLKSAPETQSTTNPNNIYVNLKKATAEVPPIIYKKVFQPQSFPASYYNYPRSDSLKKQTRDGYTRKIFFDAAVRPRGDFDYIDIDEFQDLMSFMKNYKRINDVN